MIDVKNVSQHDFAFKRLVTAYVLRPLAILRVVDLGESISHRNVSANRRDVAGRAQVLALGMVPILVRHRMNHALRVLAPKSDLCRETYAIGLGVIANRLHDTLNIVIRDFIVVIDENNELSIGPIQ